MCVTVLSLFHLCSLRYIGNPSDQKENPEQEWDAFFSFMNMYLKSLAATPCRNSLARAKIAAAPADIAKKLGKWTLATFGPQLKS